MSSFLFGGNAPPAAKTDFSPLPGGADPTRWMAATDFNALRSELQDVKMSKGVQLIPSVAGLSAHNVTLNLPGGAGAIHVVMDAAPNFLAPTVGSVDTNTVFSVFLSQDATGYRVPTWNAAFKGVSNVLARQGPNQISRLDFKVNGDGTVTLVGFDAIDLTKPINVQDYGTAFNGADNYPAIQAALNTGRDIYLPACTPQNYTVGQPVLMQTSGQKIFAEHGAQIQGLGGHIMPLIAIAPPIGSYPGLPTSAALLTGSGVAAHFDGTSNYWLGLSDNPHVTFSGLSQFTVEFAINFDTISSGVSPLGCASYDVDGTAITTFRPALGTAGGGAAPVSLTCHIGGSQVSVNSVATLTAGNTYKLAFTYDGSKLRIFINGVKDGEVSASGTVDQLLWSDWCVGKCPQFMCESGYVLPAAACVLDGVRLSDTARYTANYTPSTAKPGWDANTIALLNFDSETAQWSRCWSRGFFNEQQQHWIFVRRELAASPAFVSSCEIHELFLNDGLMNSAIWAIHATDTTLVNVSSNCKVKLLDNCFNFTMRGGHISVPSIERDAIMLGNACGASYMEGTEITGGKYQIRMLETGITIVGTRMQPSADTVACFVSNGFAAGDNPTLDLVGVSIDGENILTGTFQAGIIGIGLHTLNLVGGVWDVPNAVAPVGKFSGCSKITAQGAFLKVNNASQEVFSKVGTCGPVTTFNAFKYPTTAPWSNTSGFVQADDGATRTNFKGLSMTDTPAANLAGTAVCTGGSGASFSFNLPNAEADASFQLVLTPKSSTGTPAAGSTRVKSYSIAAGPPTAVTVVLEADPGGGNTVTFSWMLIRA
jgi:hypothetical protein